MKLERVKALRGRKILHRVHDPAARYVAVRCGDVVEVLATADLALRARFDDLAGDDLAIAPNGLRIAAREGNELVIRTAQSTAARVTTATTPTERFGNEALGFTHDGRHVWLAARDREGRACVQLYDLTLALVDAFADVRSYSPYSLGPGQAFEQMTDWSEAWFLRQHHAPEWVLGVANTGDSCAGVFAFRVVNDRIVMEQEALQQAIFDAVGAYFLRAIALTASGELLVMDRDSFLAVLPWPIAADSEPRVKTHPGKSWRDDDYDLGLPFTPKGEYLHIIGDISTTAEHVLVGVENDHGTVGLIVLDATTLEPCGLVEVPPIKGYLAHLGSDLFASETAFWRLQ